jgi:diaminohydroxyphosphoribosylaminopyrimidine deaminase/5-amino-6-(5-phosphoribosylamino)uracil reductase
MISSKTLNIDNPKLNCRLKGFEKFSPKRIILDRNLEIKMNSYIFKTSKKKNTLIFHNSSNNNKIKILKKKGITLIRSKVDNKRLFNFRIILKKLYTLGTRNLLVEGGDEITKNLIKNRLFDKFYLLRSPKNLLLNKKHQIFTSSSILNTIYKKKSKINSKLVKDNITIYKR